MESLSKQQNLSRKFFCDFLGCGKSFTRAEHLQRHELNHRESISTCKRCLAHFSRPDLLERHMERHAQKDKEAGGEGLGVLVTRKRCWRDENGNITTKRPASSVAAIEKALEARRQKRGDSGDEGGSSNGGGNTGGPIPPPYLSTPPSPAPQDGPNIRNGPGMHGGLEIQPLQDFPSYGFLAATVPLQPKYQLSPPAQGVTTSVSLQANFDGHSRVDAIQSSEMPFTMLNTCNYNWLLEELRMLENSHGNIWASFDQSSAISRNQAGTNMAIKPAYGGDNGVLSLLVNGHEFIHFEGKPSSQQQDQQFVQQNLHGPKQQLDQGPTEIAFEQQAYYLTGSINDISPASGNPNSDTIDIRKSPHVDSFLSHQHAHNTASQTRCPHVSPHPYGFYCALSVSPESQHPFPEINQVARQQVLELIFRASPSMTSGPHFSWDNPLLSLSALQNYSDLFFSRFNSTYPLIHRQSFDPSSVNTLLLASMLTLGAACGGKDAHKMAVRIHDILRGILANSDYFRTTPELWVLQTLLMIEVFGRSKAGMGQHDMAHLFHGLLIDI